VHVVELLLELVDAPAKRAGFLERVLDVVLRGVALGMGIRKRSVGVRQSLRAKSTS
jgi:hypothetical protein